MRRIELLRKIIYAISALIVAAISFILWITGMKTTTILLCGSSIILLFIMLFLMDMLHQYYTDNLLIQLSRLVDSIIDMREDEIFSDVEDTLLSKLQSQVSKLSGILKAQNRLIKSEKEEIKSLITDISHQIKTPVASIKTFGELLQEPGLTEQQRTEYLQILCHSLDKLTFLTDSMIKMSRLESGIIRLIPQSEKLADIILQAVKEVYNKAKNKNIEIIFDGNNEIMLTIDKNWTAEAIFNILDNAVKYTPDGGKIIITVLKYESFTRVDITDNGMGIPEPEQANIFKRFYRGQNANNFEGVGIGLYLSRKIITDQGGYIKVKSNKNGSIFSTFLPL